MTTHRFGGPLFYLVLFTVPLSMFIFLQNNNFINDYRLSLLVINAVCLLLFLTLEQLIPFHKEWNQNQKDLGSDLILTFLALPGAFALAEFLLDFFLRDLNLSWPFVKWPIFFQVFIGLCFGEFFFYWFHRLGHQQSLLWSWHQVHHSRKRVYLLNSGSFHFIDGFIGAILYLLPLKILGCPQQVYALVLAIGLITGYLEHANIFFHAGPLNFIFNTAELHRWHHAVPEQCPPSNFGKALSIYDWIFKTISKPSIEVPVIGLELERSEA